jgi:DNA-directed RNA polymerase subunit beta
MITVKSDDIFGRTATTEALIKGEPIKPSNIPASFTVLVSELRAMGFNMDLIGARFFKDRREQLMESITAAAVPDEELRKVKAEETEPKES